MAIRWYAVCAVLATVGFLLFAAYRTGLVAMPEAGLRSASLRATWTVDLESGSQGTPQADLHWGMAARDQPYLGVLQRGAAPGALIAQPGALRWEELDAAALAKLAYSPNRYSAWGPDAPVRKGAVFGVRTAEGNFAKVRIAGIGQDYQLKIDWLLFAVPKEIPVQKEVPVQKESPAQASKTSIVPGPSLAWLALRDEALAAYRAERFQEALDACGKAVAAAQAAGEAQHALALVTCGGLLGMHRRAAAQMEDWLRQSVALSAKLDQQAIVAALGPNEIMLKERCLHMLGVFYRDQNRQRDAAQNFALAVDTVRAMPPPETGVQRLALRSNLYDLGLALAQTGMRGTARQALGEARDYYLKTEPDHPTLKAIEAQLQSLEEPMREPPK